MEKPSPNSSRSRELQCVGRLEILKPKPVGFLCGSIPVPTDKAFHVFNSALVPSTQTLRAPRYRMLPNETDLNTLPLLSSIPEKILPIAAVQSRTSGGVLKNVITSDQGSTSDPAEQSSTSAPYLIPISQRCRRRRSVFAAEMGRQKAVAKDLLANIPNSVDAQSAPTQPKSKTKRIKKTQPKTKVTQINTENTLPISKLASSERTTSVAEKRPAEGQPSDSPKSKKPRSSAATTSGSRKQDFPWAPQITLEDKPVQASDSADDINVGVALSTALLLPGDLDRNAELSEYENYALMLQRSIQAIQHAHSFSVQSFENRKELADKKREVASLQKANKSLQSQMKTLEDQAEAAIKAQNVAKEKAESAEAIKKVLEVEKRVAKEKMTQAQKELQEALATKEAEVKAADKKGYNEGVADVTTDYEKQVKQACNKGFTLGWMSLLKKLEVPKDSPLRNSDVIPLPFPPTPSQSNDESESEEKT
ncbi:unnamed protein product [Camellia sinensis]